MRKYLCLCLSIVILVACQAHGRQRSELAVGDTWNLEDLYATEAAWEAAKVKLGGQFEGVLQYKGKLGRSARDLLACLKFTSDLSREFARLSCYASMKSDEDTRVSKYQAMQQELRQMATNLGTLASFIDPELAQLSRATIDQFLAAEPGLKEYRFRLYDIQRMKKYTLSEKEEKIMAGASMLTGSAASIYSVFSNAEFPYPEIALSDGRKVRLDKAGYGLYRASTNRADREAVFNAFFGEIDKFRQTFGSQLYANVQADIFRARARGYDSSLHSALYPNNIPVAVYHALIDNVNRNLDSFQRYLKIKKKMMGVDQLKYSDIYAPTVEGVDLKYDYEAGSRLVLEALAPLGDNYVNVVRQAINQRWIDVYPSTGKRAGAYSNGGAYDVHPYILLNYNGLYDDVSTLAHELGHTMQSYYSNKTQPFATADYSIFVAEVASTFNEALLNDMMLKKIKNKEVRLSLLMSYLDGMKNTLFRQTQFAEFELRIHEEAEKGRPLTGDTLTEIYGDILRRYYGHDQGVCQIDDLYAVEWAYVPHFYYNFYVYQYATSYCASTALSEKVLAGEPGAAEKYLKFISAGGSDYPINLLKEAGVDMTTAQPFDKTIQAINRAMDQIESLID